MSQLRIMISWELLAAMCEQGAWFVTLGRSAKCIRGISPQASVQSVDVQPGSIVLHVDDPGADHDDMHATAAWEVVPR